MSDVPGFDLLPGDPHAEGGFLINPHVLHSVTRSWRIRESNNHTAGQSYILISTHWSTKLSMNDILYQEKLIIWRCHPSGIYFTQGFNFISVSFQFQYLFLLSVKQNLQTCNQIFAFWYFRFHLLYFQSHKTVFISMLFDIYNLYLLVPEVVSCLYWRTSKFKIHLLTVLLHRVKKYLMYIIVGLKLVIISNNFSTTCESIQYVLYIVKLKTVFWSAFCFLSCLSLNSLEQCFWSGLPFFP